MQEDRLRGTQLGRPSVSSVSFGWYLQDLGPTACTVVPSRPNSNRSSHSREPRSSAAANRHLRAASLARRLKYLLGPGLSKLSCTTRPELSTVTRTPTFTCPWMVPRALSGTLGISSWSVVLARDVFLSGGVDTAALSVAAVAGAGALGEGARPLEVVAVALALGGGASGAGVATGAAVSGTTASAVCSGLAWPGNNRDPPHTTAATTSRASSAGTNSPRFDSPVGSENGRESARIGGSGPRTAIPGSGRVKGRGGAGGATAGIGLV
jgi:hypothetical protein